MLEGGGGGKGGGGRYLITKMDELFPCIYLHARSYYLRHGGLRDPCIIRVTLVQCW